MKDIVAMLVGVIILFFYLFAMLSGELQAYNEKLEQCQADLLRNQKCVLIAVVEE